MAVPNPRLLIISLTVFVFHGFDAVSDLRLLIISPIAFNGVPWYGATMRQLCCWNVTVERRMIVGERVRLANYGSVNVLDCSQLRAAVVAGSHDTHSACPMLLPIRYPIWRSKAESFSSQRAVKAYGSLKLWSH